MSYVKRHRTGSMIPAQQALGGISDIGSAIRNVVEDPCLFQVAKDVNRLADIISPPAKPGAPPKPPTKGIGLCSAVRPIRIATYIAERPWIVPLGITALVGSLVGIGYAIGRGR